MRRNQSVSELGLRATCLDIGLDMRATCLDGNNGMALDTHCQLLDMIALDAIFTRSSLFAFSSARFEMVIIR